MSPPRLTWQRRFALQRARDPRLGARAFRTQRAELLYELRQNLDDAIDFFLRREHAEAEAQGILRPVRRKAHRAQHVRRLERSRRTGGAGRDGDAFEVERDQQALGFDALEADVR